MASAIATTTSTIPNPDPNWEEMMATYAVVADPTANRRTLVTRGNPGRGEGDWIEGLNPRGDQEQPISLILASIEYLGRDRA
jgi:hypothetical protein